MRSIRKLYWAISLSAGILIIFYLLDMTSVDKKTNYHKQSRQTTEVVPVIQKDQPQSRHGIENEHTEIIISLVVCGDRLQEALVLVKSAIIFQLKYALKFIILAEDELIPSLEEKLSDWQILRNHTFKFEILNLQFPKDREKEWKSLFKKCAAQRLFLPNILSDVDAVLYLDVDTLFLGPVYDVWRHFDRMNSSQMVALANETDDLNSGWYNRFARHPYYGKQGVNSGVMLMNLTRMRQFGWGDYLGPIYKEFKTKITFGDQDIINIILYYHPDKVYVYPCRFNFRSDHCRYMPNCESAMAAGVVVLHGSRSSFLSNKVPAFAVIFQAFQEYQLDEEVHERLLIQLEFYLTDTITTSCGANYKTIYLKVMRKIFQPWAVSRLS